ncbi:MAG TPA: ATP-binding cassette domain-containing protein [Myxococcota bacterium]|nr:ATP-binding cassette domain-containing protein [Myxococcota bacterium]
MGWIAEIASATLTLSGTRVLDGAELRLAPGRIHALVGPGGGGKTLLLKVLATLLAPDAGEVRLFGTTVDPRDGDALRDLRARIGMQFQNLALFDFLSVADNVGFPLVQDRNPPPADQVAARVEAALASVRLPDAGSLAVQALSGGMQRRVAVARAAVARPDLLLFDDPSGGLDPVTTSRIFALIGDVQARQGCTVVVASHDIDRLARICTDFHVVHGGRVIFSGSLADGRASDDPRVRMYLDVRDADA